MPRQAPPHTPHPHPHPQPVSGRIVLAAVLSAKADVDTALAPARVWLTSQHATQLVGTHIQRRGVSRSLSAGGASRLDAAMHPAMFFGTGSVQQLAQTVANTRADGVLVLNALSATQRERLAQAVGCAVHCWQS